MLISTLHLVIAHVSFLLTLWVAFVLSLVQWRKKDIPGQKLIMFLAVGALDLSILIGIAYTILINYVSVVHLLLALGAAVVLHYVSWKFKNEGVTLQLVGLAWLAAALLIISSIIRWI